MGKAHSDRKAMGSRYGLIAPGETDFGSPLFLMTMMPRSALSILTMVAGPCHGEASWDPAYSQKSTAIPT